MGCRVVTSFREKCPFCDIPPHVPIFYKGHVPLGALAHQNRIAYPEEKLTILSFQEHRQLRRQRVLKIEKVPGIIYGLSVEEPDLDLAEYFCLKGFYLVIARGYLNRNGPIKTEILYGAEELGNRTAFAPSRSPLPSSKYGAID